MEPDGTFFDGLSKRLAESPTNVPLGGAVVVLSQSLAMLLLGAVAAIAFAGSPVGPPSEGTANGFAEADGGTTRFVDSADPPFDVDTIVVAFSILSLPSDGGTVVFANSLLDRAIGVDATLFADSPIEWLLKGGRDGFGGFTAIRPLDVEVVGFAAFWGVEVVAFAVSLDMEDNDCAVSLIVEENDFAVSMIVKGFDFIVSFVVRALGVDLFVCAISSVDLANPGFDLEGWLIFSESIRFLARGAVGFVAFVDASKENGLLWCDLKNWTSLLLVTPGSRAGFFSGCLVLLWPTAGGSFAFGVLPP